MGPLLAGADGEEDSVSALPRPEPLVSTAAVREYLDVSKDTMAKMIADTPAGYARPWIDIGSGRQPHYRWRLGGVLAWAQEVQRAREAERRAAERLRWQRSNDTAPDGASGGDGPGAEVARNSPGDAPTLPQPSASPVKSTPASTPAATGSPLSTKLRLMRQTLR